MNDFSRDLVDLMTVRPEGEGVFVGDTEPYGVPGRLFGGHFVAQALDAAFATIPEHKLAHSLHAYFHRTGDSSAPVRYVVDVLRDGRSFSARRVTATQAGEVVFSLSASFKARDADEFFQVPMPDVPDAETLAAEHAAAGRPEPSGPPTAGGRVRLVPASNAFKPREMLEAGEERSVHFRNWLRVLREGALTDRQAQLLIAFLSDGPLPFCSAVRHGDPFGTHQHLSLDHGVWFHRIGDPQGWMLFDATSVATADGRGLNDGRLFSSGGELIASIRQESLLRRLRDD